MKIKMACSKCAEDKNFGRLIDITLSENFHFKGECKNGHKYEGTVFGVLRFEYFLSCAAEALINGYYVEACFNFALAREHFLLCGIAVMGGYRSNKNEKGKEQNKTKINLNKSSERVLGAFMSLYFLHFRDDFEIEKAVKKMNLVEFRNKIVHKGYISSKDETFEYGETIFNEIRTTFDKFYEKFGGNCIFQYYAENELPPNLDTSPNPNLSIFNTGVYPFFSFQKYIFQHKAIPEDKRLEAFSCDSFEKCLKDYECYLEQLKVLKD